MAKRRRTGGESLTGGSGDVNPQYMHGSSQFGLTGTYMEYSYNTPVVRIPGGNDVTIMEILKIFIYWADFPGATAARIDYYQDILFSTIAFGITEDTFFFEPNVFAMAKAERISAVQANPMLESDATPCPFVYDLTDGAGHGFLLAGDRFFVKVFNYLIPTEKISWKILYRFKRVNLKEYVGIVQSQQ